MKSSTYYFHMKTKTLSDFQICISVPLIDSWKVNPYKYVKSILSPITKTQNFMIIFVAALLQLGKHDTRSS